MGCVSPALRQSWQGLDDPVFLPLNQVHDAITHAAFAGTDEGNLPPVSHIPERARFHAEEAGGFVSLHDAVELFDSRVATCCLKHGAQDPHSCRTRRAAFFLLLLSLVIELDSGIKRVAF
jgi:hypothetical protein